MRLLLDTNALYWLLTGSPRLGPLTQRALVDATLIVSDICLLELSIKVSIGKLEALPSLHAVVDGPGFERTRIELRFLKQLEGLPLLHRDPFDRLLIAQALTDGLTVVTADPRFAQYGAHVIEARE